MARNWAELSLSLTNRKAPPRKAGPEGLQPATISRGPALQSPRPSGPANLLKAEG